MISYFDGARVAFFQEKWEEEIEWEFQGQAPHSHLPRSALVPPLLGPSAWDLCNSTCAELLATS